MKSYEIASTASKYAGLSELAKNIINDLESEFVTPAENNPDRKPYHMMSRLLNRPNEHTITFSVFDLNIKAEAKCYPHHGCVNLNLYSIVADRNNSGQFKEEIISNIYAHITPPNNIKRPDGKLFNNLAIELLDLLYDFHKKTSTPKIA